MNETINLLAFVVTIIVVVGSTLYGVYKVVTATEQRSSQKIDSLKEEMTNLKLCVGDKKSEMENKFQQQINDVRTKQVKMESDLQDMDKIFDEINSIKDTIKDIYNKINNLTNKIMMLIEKK